jgi:TatD DNase family protein
MIIIDSHCHLNMAQFKEELDQVIANAASYNVNYMQTICTKISDFSSIIAIAEKYDNVFASVGVHPNEVESDDIVTSDELVKLSMHHKVIGLGETGLDYYHNNTDKDVQISSFRNHISASRKTGLPVIIHSRDADKDTIQILKEEMQNGVFPGLIHCFSTGEELAYEAIKLGLYISIAGIVTFKNAENLQRIVRDLPLDKLLVETDSPYLAPVPERGKRNEPAFTYHVVKYIAELKNLDIGYVADITTKNFCDLFKKFGDITRNSNALT